jgi:hypothetical protein
MSAAAADVRTIGAEKEGLWAFLTFVGRHCGFYRRASGAVDPKVYRDDFEAFAR